MNIFVSHSLTDKELIKNLQSTLEPHGIKLYIAEHHVDINRTITEKIEGMIRSCDIALILLTENGYNSNFVHQEIGYIKSCEKPILQLIQFGIEKKLSGFTYGRDYITYDPLEPKKAISAIENKLLEQFKIIEKIQLAEAERIFSNQRNLETQKINTEKANQETRLGIMLLAVIVVLGLTSSK